MTKRRWIIALCCSVGIPVVLAFAPAPVRGHWAQPKYYGDREDPFFITYVDGKGVAFHMTPPPFIISTYRRTGLRCKFNDRVGDCVATAYATPFFLFYSRPSKGESWVLVRDFRRWVEHPDLSEVAQMEFTKEAEPNHNLHPIPNRADAVREG